MPSPPPSFSTKTDSVLSRISVLREKAAASCLGVRHDHDPTALGPLRIPSPVNVRAASLMLGHDGSPLSTVSSSTW